METLAEIIARITAHRDANEPIVITALDPDLGRGKFAGEVVELDGVAHVHRPWRVWIELADRLGLRMLTPRVAGPLVELRFEPLALAPVPLPVPEPERYGPDSAFARISKLEDPGFAIDLAEALDRIALPPGARVLELGVNRGDVLAAIAARDPSARLVGVDHGAAAIAVARARLGDRAVLHVADVHALGTLGIDRCDLAIAIGTLQSAGIDDRAVLRALVQDHLTPDGAVLIGVPNCRYVDGELAYGARMKNFRQPELGLAIKDVAFYRKYLQQHHREVFVTGRNYWFVTGVARRERNHA